MRRKSVLQKGIHLSKLGAGRPPKRIESFNNLIAYDMFRIMNIYLKKLTGEDAENMSAEKLKEAAEFIKPFALKAMPEKIKLESEDNQDFDLLLRHIQSLAALDTDE